LSETLVYIYQTTPRHISDDLNLKIHIKGHAIRAVCLYTLRIATLQVASDVCNDGGINCVDAIPSPSLPHQETS
jgi:hypothetical protein